MESLRRAEAVLLVIFYSVMVSRPAPLANLSPPNNGCNGFPQSYSGCWKMLDVESTYPQPEKFILLSKSCMITKEKVVCGEISCKLFTVALLQRSNNDTEQTTFTISKDNKTISMAKMKCHRTHEVRKPEKCGPPRDAILMKSDAAVSPCKDHLTLSQSGKIGLRDISLNGSKDQGQKSDLVVRDARRRGRGRRGSRGRGNPRGRRRGSRGRGNARGRRRGSRGRGNARGRRRGSRGRGNPRGRRRGNRNNSRNSSRNRSRHNARNRGGKNRKRNRNKNRNINTRNRSNSRNSNNRKGKARRNRNKKQKGRGRGKKRGDKKRKNTKKGGGSKPPSNKQKFAKKADATAKKLAGSTVPKAASKISRRPNEKLKSEKRKTAKPRKPKGKFEKKLKNVEKDIAKEKKKKKTASNMKPTEDDKKSSTTPKVSFVGGSKGSFAENVDATAGKLAKKENQVPSIPRQRPAAETSSGTEQEKFQQKVKNVAKDFASKDQDSPRAFDQLVNKVGHDLAKYIPKMRGKGGDKVYIPRGQTVTLDCVRDEETRAPVPSLKAKWRKDGQALAEGRYQVTSQGDLKIKEVETHDTGMYRCDAVEVQKNGKRKLVTRFHKVMVYRIPVLNYFFTIRFKTSGCSEINTDEVTAYFKSKVCASSPCVLRDVLSKCPVSTTNLYIEGNVVLGAEYKTPAGCASPKCKIDAMKNELQKRLVNVKNFVSGYKSGEAKYGKISNELYNLVLLCESGYQQSNVMCTPCYPGFYSPTSDPACHRCPMNTYQDNFGALRCLKCPGFGKTQRPGATSVENCRAGLKIKIGDKSVHMETLAMYAGAGIGVIGLIFMIATCIYMRRKIQENPDVPKKEVIKGEMTKAKKKAGKGAKKVKAKAKALKGKKGKETEEDEDEEDEEEEDDDETNENVSAKVPLLRSSRPKYDKNSRNLRKIEKEGIKQSRESSHSRHKDNKNKEEGIKQSRESSHSRQKDNKNRNNPAGDPEFTSSCADIKSGKSGAHVGLKGSRSESTACNTRAVQNAALMAKHTVNNRSLKPVQEEATVDDSKRQRPATPNSVDNSRPSPRVTNTREILSEGKAKYGSGPYARLIAKTKQTGRGNTSPSSVHSSPAYFVHSPAPSSHNSMYSTPTGALSPAQCTDSWYGSDWNSTGSTTTCASARRADDSRSQLSKKVSGTVTPARTVESWYDSVSSMP